MKAIRLGKLLVEEKIISEEQLTEALSRQQVLKKRLGEVLVDLEMVSERQILQSLARRLNVEYLESPMFSIELEVVSLVPETLAKKYGIVPLNLKAGSLTIATNDPLDLTCLEDIAIVTGLDIKTVISPKAEIERALNRVYSRRSADEIINDIKDEYGKSALNNDVLINTQETEDMAERVGSAPVVKLVNNLIFDAYQQNASDIHIEPTENKTRVRFRIDGDLQLHNEFNNEAHQLITTRIKIISGMNIAEKRIPQDGGFQFKNDFSVVDIRVSSMPTPYGEKIVLRLLGADRNIDYNLASLGLTDYTQSVIRKALRLPHGIILVTGPTGSGKTTTLYSMLAQLASPKKNLITVEDPIERKFPGITQIQVNERAGLTFANGLRSILRQDPDIIMVGEIRDAETAEIAIRAAITGHLVLSTIHTNDALSTVVRLIDMNVEPFLVASSVRCVISQRLVKKICTYCKEEVNVELADNLLLKTNLSKAKKGLGCDHCNHTGYTGRTAVFEVVLIDAKLEAMISNRASMDEMRTYASTSKIRMLREEVLDLIHQGVTTVDEGINILYTTE